MLTAHQIKILHSLDKKKFRQKHHLFVVEGNKNIAELQHSAYKIKALFSINPNELQIPGIDITKITEKELKNISFLQNPKDSVALCEPLHTKILPLSGVQIFLDGLQDPGNAGTIIRLADWFGVEQIVCSEDTVDFYNPKVIQASMGSFTRVNMVYENLNKIIKETPIPVYGTAMVGENLYETNFPSDMILVFGNEGNGIKKEIFDIVEKKITIPRFGKNKSAESLNVATAAAIILGQIYSVK